MISIIITDSVCKWMLIGFYGPPYRAKRHATWENLHAFLETVEGPWVCLGDFNVVLDDFAKEGGRVDSSLQREINLGTLII
jgi:hypothetical protein